MIQQQKDDWQVQKGWHRKCAAPSQGRGGAGAGGEDRPAERCPRCYIGHRQGSCGALGRRCYSCQGWGHYARACPMEGEYGPDEQQAGRRVGYSSDTESFYNEQSDSSTGGSDSDDMESSDDQEGHGSPSSERSDGGTGNMQEPEKDSQSLEGKCERLSRALATLDGYQGTEPGPEEDESEGTGEKPEEAKSSEGEDNGMKALREGTEPAWPGSQQWKRQMNKRKSKSKRKLKQGK